MSIMWHVTCGTCLIDGTDRALVIRESCADCADSVAASHRAQGHTVTITRPIRERVWESSKTTQTLLGKGRNGW